MKIILFDFDGVIADTYSFCYRIISSNEALTHDEYKARFEGNINDAIRKIGQDTKRIDFWGEYEPELMKCQPNTELTNMIQQLSKDHVLIIISSTISLPIKKFLDIYELSSCFKEILGNDVEKSKIKKIQDVLERYYIKPEEAVFITDTLGDIKEAKKCGVESIAVTWGYHPRKTLQKGNPRIIINHPSELIKAIGTFES